MEPYLCLALLGSDLYIWMSAHFFTQTFTDRWCCTNHFQSRHDTLELWGDGLMEGNQTCYWSYMCSLYPTCGVLCPLSKSELTRCISFHLSSCYSDPPPLGFLPLSFSVSPREDHVEGRQHNLAAECVQLGQWRHLHILPFLERHMLPSFVFANGVEYVCVSVTWILFLSITWFHFENKVSFLTVVCSWTYSAKCF